MWVSVKESEGDDKTYIVSNALGNVAMHYALATINKLSVLQTIMGGFAEILNTFKFLDKSIWHDQLYHSQKIYE